MTGLRSGVILILKQVQDISESKKNIPHIFLDTLNPIRQTLNSYLSNGQAGGGCARSAVPDVPELWCESQG